MRQPISIKEHKGNGTYRPSRHKGRLEEKVSMVEGVPEPPKYFDKRHRDKWQTTCKRVFNMGVLSEADLDLLEIYVVHWFIHHDASKVIERDGLITANAAGSLCKHPATTLLNEAAKVLNQIAEKFGMSSSARMRIKTQDRPQHDPGAEFLNN